MLLKSIAMGRTEKGYKLCPKGSKTEVWIEKVKDTALDEESSKPTKCPLWRKPRAFWQTGNISRWQTSAQEEGHDERWKASRSWESCLTAKQVVEAGKDLERSDQVSTNSSKKINRKRKGVCSSLSSVKMRVTTVR